MNKYIKVNNPIEPPEVVVNEIFKISKGEQEVRLSFLTNEDISLIMNSLFLINYINWGRLRRGLYCLPYGVDLKLDLHLDLYMEEVLKLKEERYSD